jgi:hypothetical protein
LRTAALRAGSRVSTAAATVSVLHLLILLLLLLLQLRYSTTRQQLSLDPSAKKKQGIVA